MLNRTRDEWPSRSNLVMTAPVDAIFKPSEWPIVTLAATRDSTVAARMTIEERFLRGEASITLKQHHPESSFVGDTT